jgi:hypothetical protein
MKTSACKSPTVAARRIQFNAMSAHSDKPVMQHLPARLVSEKRDTKEGQQVGGL